MVVLKAAISEELDQKFREKVLEKFGFKRGALTEAMVEALENWVKLVNENEVQDIDTHSIQNDYPDRYLAIHEGEIIVNENSLIKLWDKIPEGKGNITIITPRMHEYSHRRQLGWKMKRL